MTVNVTKIISFCTFTAR